MTVLTMTPERPDTRKILICVVRLGSSLRSSSNKTKEKTRTEYKALVEERRSRTWTEHQLSEK